MKVWAGLVAAVLVCAGCSGSGGDASSGGAHRDVRICVYTHGNSGSFWTTVKDGAEQAADDLGVTLDYQEADDDLEAQVHLIEDGIKAGCDGMAVSAPDPQGLQHAADEVHDAGIPLVTMVAGAAAYQQLHAFTHVGQDDTVVGQEAGTRLAGLGATRLLCVEQAGEDPALDQVCAGARSGAADVETLKLAKGVDDLPQSQSELEDRLRTDPRIDAVLSLDPDLAVGAVLPAVRAAGRSITVGAVGISPAAVRAVKAGTLAFATDEEPFAEGYLPVVLLYLDATNADQVGGDRPVYTGPAFVTQENADRIAELEAAGTR